MANSLIARAVGPTWPIRDPLTAEEIEEIHALIKQLALLTRRGRLTARQRLELARWLFPGSGSFVQATAEGVGANRRAFDDFPIDLEELGTRNRRGQRLLHLATMLTILAGRLKDQAYRDRSTAVQDAMAIVKKVRAEQALPFMDPDRLARRKSALCLAERVLETRQKQNVKAARLRKAAREVQAEKAARGKTGP